MQGIPVALCAGLGPLAAGWLYDVLHHYELAFWLCAGAFLLAAIGLAIVPRPEQKERITEPVDAAQVKRTISEYSVED
jgi:cyanate permease